MKEDKCYKIYREYTIGRKKLLYRVDESHKCS